MPSYDHFARFYDAAMDDPVPAGCPRRCVASSATSPEPPRSSSWGAGPGPSSPS